MTFTDYQSAFSIPRLDTYLNACSGDQNRTIRAYKANLKMSQSFLGVLNVFEVTLRNETDAHYRKRFGNNWILSESSPNGFLRTKGCERSLKNVETTIKEKFTDKNKPFNQNEAICHLGFGFGSHLFASKEYNAAGNTLLQIFSKRPKGVRQGQIFSNLQDINHIRNRIAHHEPFCFTKLKLPNQPRILSNSYAMYNYRLIADLMKWMNYDMVTLLSDTHNFLADANNLSNI